MLTHKNVLHSIAAIQGIAVTGGIEPGNENDVFLSWLPLAHIMVKLRL